MAQIAPTLVKFPITPQLQSGGSVDWKELELKVDGPHEIAELNIGEENGKVYVSFKASVIGAYKCNITYHDDPLRNTPITVNLGKKEDAGAAPPEKKPQPVLRMREFRTIRFRVPSKHSANNLSVYVAEGPDRNPARSVVLQEGGLLAVCLDVTKPGDYRVGVKGSSGDIEGSPFRINVPQLAFNP